MITRGAVKDFLGELPLAAETYWFLRQPGKPVRGFLLNELQAALPTWRGQAEQAARNAPRGKRVLLFATLPYWISHTALLGLALAGHGHRVSLGYLPYGRWQKAVKPFDLRRHNLYARNLLRQAAPQLASSSLMDVKTPPGRLPGELQQAIEEVSLRDTQYTLQVEEVSLESELYRLRLARNTAAACAALSWFQTEQPEVVIIPNGTILELGAVYRVARYLGIPVTTYEFGEQRQRIWLAQDGEVMRQNTDALWAARGRQGLTPAQAEQVQALLSARQRGGLWQNFARRWQGVPSEGGEQARAALGLDGRPVVLLATNVIGDSLTLGRQVFSDSMTGWLERSIEFFARHPEAQLVIRIHPGELVTRGPSVAQVVQKVLPHGLPEHIHLVSAETKLNTYDLVEIADLGLVYTTTVGLEMAMSGVPVIAIGQTHYRGKGFTLDADSWEAYFSLLEQALSSPDKLRLSQGQVELAWEYAYRFFFEYPHPFPWHMVHMWEDVDAMTLTQVLSPDGLAKYGNTFRYLVGEAVDWTDR